MLSDEQLHGFCDCSKVVVVFGWDQGLKPPNNTPLWDAP